MKNYSFQERDKLVRQTYEMQHDQMQYDDSRLKEICLDANSIDIGLDTKIYRIFRYEYLLDALRTGELCFVRPQNWEDPYENFLLKAKGIDADKNEISLDGIKNTIFAQCWSTREECDGLWRTYSCNAKRKQTKDVAIKVETTVGKMFSEFYDISTHCHQLTYFVGKVKYVADTSLRQFLRKEVLNDVTGMGSIMALLLKRKAFSYENEVRFIYRADTASDPSDWSYRWKFHADNVFDKITIEPWASKWKIGKITKELSKYYKGTIEKDPLYDEPQWIIKL